MILKLLLSLIFLSFKVYLKTSHYHIQHLKKVELKFMKSNSLKFTKIIK